MNERKIRQLAVKREQKIKEEELRFENKHPELLHEYAGEYVAMQNGEIEDHDPDQLALFLCVKKRYENKPVLIALIDENPKPVYNMRSPHLIRR